MLEARKDRVPKKGIRVPQNFPVWFSLGKAGFGLGGYSAAVDFVLTSNLNELTDMSC